jgi:hypothetical protein
MISFVLVIVSLKTVAIAALVGMIIGLLWHSRYLFGSCCQQACGDKNQACMPGQKCDQGYPSVEKHDTCCNNCNWMCMGLYKVIGFGLAFVQAYGIAFLLERMNVLGDYKDAIALTIFVALTFAVAKMAAKTMWHGKSWTHFAVKVACRLVILSSMAAVIVYLS